MVLAISRVRGSRTLICLGKRDDLTRTCHARSSAESENGEKQDVNANRLEICFMQVGCFSTSQELDRVIVTRILEQGLHKHGNLKVTSAVVEVVQVESVFFLLLMATKGCIQDDFDIPQSHFRIILTQQTSYLILHYRISTHKPDHQNFRINVQAKINIQAKIQTPKPQNISRPFSVPHDQASKNTIPTS